MSKWFDHLFARKKSVADDRVPEIDVKVDLLSESVTQRKRGNEFLDHGDLRKAVDCYRDAVRLAPNSVEALTSFGFALKELGDVEEAKDVLHKAARLRPDDFDAFYLLGQIYNEQRQFDDASIHFQKALSLRVDVEPLYGELCHVLFQVKAVDRAAEVIGNGIERYPNNASFHLFKGNLNSSMKKWSVAAASYKTALTLDPKLTQAHTNLAAVFRVEGDLDAAAHHAECALQTDPASPDTHACIAANLGATGKLDAALSSYEKALAVDPEHPTATCGKGIVLLKLGRPDDAIQWLSKALTIEPDSAEIYRDLSQCYLELSKYDEAAEHSRKALALRPLYPSAQNYLGMALRSMGRLQEAQACYQAGLLSDPNSEMFLNNLGDTLLAQGRMPGALSSFRRALESNPQSLTANAALCYSNLLFCLSHNEEQDAQTLFDEHCRFAEKFEVPLRGTWPRHTNSREPARKLEVGFVSGDFRTHVVAQFVGPVLERLKGHPGLSLHAYYNNAVQDSETQRLKAFFDHWHSVVGLPDAAVAKQIGEDRIDILIDLSGHTALNRLLIFAQKAAPVQVSWLGYPGTTGLQAMDYYLADQMVLPTALFHDQFTEKIVHLPALAPFQPSGLSPPVNTLPALVNGFVTFGSFNRASKINRVVAAWWAELLRAVPTARMLIEGVPEDGDCMQWLAQEGIARERLSWHGRNGLQAYHALHHQVDVCLDTFPYNGATTSWSALWMGVPTLTVAGDTPAGGYGAAIMGQMDLSIFVANDLQDFVRKGVYWATHLEELAELRAGMRQRFSQSAAGQPDLIAQALANALRIMWQRWCKGLPAETFVASVASDCHAGVGVHSV